MNHHRPCGLWACVLGLAALAADPSPATGQGAESADDAASPAGRPLLHISIYTDNDVFFYKPQDHSDRQYTNGVGLSVAAQHPWADALASVTPFADAFGPSRNAIGLMTGQLMHTPDDITVPTLITNDRPYAGYLFGGLFWQRSNDLTMDHFQIEVGMTGPSSLAEDAQAYVHKVIGGDDPRGWGHQIPDEVAVQLRIHKRWRFDIGQFDLAGGQLDVQVVPQVGLAAGMVHRHVEGGALLRIGSNLPDDFGPGRLLNPGDATGGLTRGWSWYLFAAGTGRLVEHNMFLEGANYHGSHGVDPKPLIGRVEFGGVLAYHFEAVALSLAYSQTHLTDEFYGQTDHHGYGSWVVSAAMTY